MMVLCRGRSRRCSSICTLRRSASRCVGWRCVSRWGRTRCQARRRSKSGLVISDSSVLLDLPRSQRNGAPRSLRCRRACGSTSGLRISTGILTPDSGHTDSLVRLDNNRSPLSRWDDLFISRSAFRTRFRRRGNAVVAGGAPLTIFNLKRQVA